MFQSSNQYNQIFKPAVTNMKANLSKTTWSFKSICHGLRILLPQLAAHVKDQFIRGVQNDILQIDILAKANLVRSLEDNVKHAEAFEIAVQDQQSLQNLSSNNLMADIISDYKKQKHSQPKKPCSDCRS